MLDLEYTEKNHSITDSQIRKHNVESIELWNCFQLLLFCDVNFFFCLMIFKIILKGWYIVVIWGQKIIYQSKLKEAVLKNVLFFIPLLIKNSCSQKHNLFVKLRAISF